MDKEVKVVIIGAGVAGIITAIKLKQKFGFTNFTIYEKAAEVGGTWRDNTYPGCACDIPVHWYSYSAELNTEWSSYYAEQPEILDYWRALASKHHLYSHVVFHARVTSLVWDNAAQMWNIEVETNESDNGNKHQETVTANLVVSAVGGFILPAYANIKGRELFQGKIFHSAEWDHGVDLKGKRVGVIGNGCSGAQIVPRISEDPSVRVVNFCRTANWFVPKTQYHYTPIAKWVFRNIPLVARIHRSVIAIWSDSAYVAWPQKNEKIRKITEKSLLLYMRKKTPEKYHEKLIPDYPLGCKRIIVDPGYYESLRRENVELDWGGVQEIVEDGLITNNGTKYELDTIIYGTGFLLVDPKLKIVGKNGQTAREYGESRGGLEAYLGTTMPGFPNLFTLLGPNVSTGHSSAIFQEEQQLLYALQLMRPVIEGKARSFEVRKEVSHAYNNDLQRRISETTWASCRSYYRVGETNMGKNVAMFPGSALRFWKLTRNVNWGDYIAVDAEKWNRERKIKTLLWFFLQILPLTLAAIFWKSKQTSRVLMGFVSNTFKGRGY